MCSVETKITLAPKTPRMQKSKTPQEVQTGAAQPLGKEKKKEQRIVITGLPRQTQPVFLSPPQLFYSTHPSMTMVTPT